MIAFNAQYLFDITLESVRVLEVQISNFFCSAVKFLREKAIAIFVCIVIASRIIYKFLDLYLSKIWKVQLELAQKGSSIRLAEASTPAATPGITRIRFRLLKETSHHNGPGMRRYLDCIESTDEVTQNCDLS